MTYTGTQNTPDATAVCREAPRQSIRVELDEISTTINKAWDMANRIDCLLCLQPSDDPGNTVEVKDVMSELQSIRIRAQWTCQSLYRIMQTLGMEG